MDSQLVKKSLDFYGTRRFITVFTMTNHWLLSLARCIQSTQNLSSYFHKIHSNITLSSTPRSSNGYFLSGFLTEIVYACFPCPMCAMWSINLILLDLITLVIFG